MHLTNAVQMSTKNTARLHRVLTTKPEKIYRAFLEPDALARWLPPNGFTGKVIEVDARPPLGVAHVILDRPPRESERSGAQPTARSLY